MGLRRAIEVGWLADQLERSIHGGAWHGPSTREVLSGIDAATAGLPPDGSPHAIVEHVRHITFWLNAAYSRIANGRDVGSDADWPKEKTLSAEAWFQVIADLGEAYKTLHTAVLELDDDRLDDAMAGSDPTVRGLLLGTLQHNAYHTGQIVLIARELAG